jgi:hypothetical protein
MIPWITARKARPGVRPLLPERSAALEGADDVDVEVDPSSLMMGEAGRDISAARTDNQRRTLERLLEVEGMA